MTIITHSCIAQSNYKQAIGLKFPVGLSVTYKNFIADTRSVEAELMYHEKGGRIAALYEFNFYTLNVDGLAWFAGPGAHIGFC